MKFLVTLIFFYSLTHVLGQELTTGNKKARKLFEEAQDAYVEKDDKEAIVLIHEALVLDSCFFEAYLLASDIYEETDSLRLQIKMLEKAVEIDETRYPKLLYVLGNAYLKEGSYKKAKKAYQAFLFKNAGYERFKDAALQKIENCEFALNLYDNPVEFKAESLGAAINTEEDEYWPSLTIDGGTLIFTRLSRLPEAYQNGFMQYQEDFYWSVLDSGGWQLAEPLTDINTPYNEGAQSVSADGKLIFFTACTQSDGFGSCDIYFTQNINGVWTKPKNVGPPVNSAAWESQPSISANGECLYFVSNRNGGRGGMDIWRCELKHVGLGILSWGKIENLGDAINTKGNEMSPFIHPDGKTLYFASDNWPGMGGLDIFYARQLNDTTWKQAVNIGYPINTHKDEQGLIVSASGEKALYSSDRPGSRGLDIYQFQLQKQARPTAVSYVKGRIFDSKSKAPLCAHVELMDVDENKLVAKAESCIQYGDFLMCLPLGKEYAFNVIKDGYLFYSENFSLREAHDVQDPFIMDISLNKIEIGEIAVLRNIFFKTGSYSILESSKPELMQLLSFLKKNPSLRIEIGGHTDTIGGEEYNQQLSENRAHAVYQFLMKKGVDEARLSYKGYGMTRPIGSNESVSGRAKNRRTEFTIISL